MRAINQCCNLSDLRALAKRRVPRAVFDYADGGANDERARNRNIAAYADWQLIPRTLRDVTEVDMRTEVLSTPLDMPLVLAPTAINHFFARCGELGVGRAAADFGTLATLSSIGSTTIEDWVKVTPPARRWYQLYMFKDRRITYDFVERCQQHKYRALVLTVDTPFGGRRERDLRHGMTIPPRLSMRTVLEASTHLNWWLPYIAGPPLRFANVRQEQGASFANMMTYMNRQFDPSVTWEDAADLIRRWQGPFAVKGIMTADDAKRAVDIGATAIIVSNHGGRQLDAAPGTLDVLPEIAAAVGGTADVICDGGIRRGADVLKAIALGAKACMTGRPYIYGLCAGGEHGVRRAVQLLRDEIRLAMQLAGCTALTQLDPTWVRRA